MTRVLSSLAIDRTSLSLTPLVLSNADPGVDPYTYPETGLTEPNFSMRVTYAPDSQWIPGRLVLGTVLDQAQMPLEVTVHGTSAANLQTLKNDLAEALAQMSYTVTLTVDGVTRGTYPACPTTVWWGVVEHSEAQVYMGKGTVSIPVNPPTA